MKTYGEITVGDRWVQPYGLSVRVRYFRTIRRIVVEALCPPRVEDGEAEILVSSGRGVATVYRPAGERVKVLS